MKITNKSQDNMADNIIIKEFNNIFVSTMDGFLQELYVLPGTYIFVAMVAISFVIHIISLKKWLDNKVKDEKLEEMI